MHNKDEFFLEIVLLISLQCSGQANKVEIVYNKVIQVGANS